MGVHDGHRQRLKEKFDEHGLEGFDDHNILELLLFYAIPRGDVNPIAHRLIDKFGSIASVFDASEEELIKVDGIGENTARLIRMIPQLSRKYMLSRTGNFSIVNTTEAAGRYLLPYFFGERDEVIYVLCLDAKSKILACDRLSRGSVNSVAINVRKIVEFAINSNATGVIMAHNHTSGIALPSGEDERTTRKVWHALDVVGIKLVDHIIVADDDFVSMADNGFFDADKKEKPKED